MIQQNTQLPKKMQELLQVPLWIFGCSWAVGTILLLLHIVMQDEIITIIGFFYTLLAIVINGIALTVFITLAFVYKSYRQEILLRAAVLLLNIPIAALYAFLALSDFFK